MSSILHICQSDGVGGAAIAARRLVLAQRASGMDARMLVVDRRSDDEFVEAAGGQWMKAKTRLARMAAKRIARIGATIDPVGMRSLAIISSGLGQAIQQRSPDIVHWHWVGAEVISLREMASIGFPAVWTCHDQWAFCGAEHYASDSRFTDSYQGCGVTDIDAMTFRRKQRDWADWHPVLICPSHWMAREARASSLMGSADIVTIPNTIDTAVFSPQPQPAVRDRLGLPQNLRIILFGADTGVADPRKGFDLLNAALETIPTDLKHSMALVTFGGEAPSTATKSGFQHFELGRLTSPDQLIAAYAAADVFVAPSRQDNLPNTLVEAQACGLPCVAFDIGGMRDIVDSLSHGELVPPFETVRLADSIIRVVAMPRDRQAIHDDAVARFGADTVVRHHKATYARLLQKTGHTE